MQTGVLKDELLLYAITCEGVELSILEKQVDDALVGGATIIQLREKNLSEDEYLQKALAVKSVCSQRGVRLIVDDSLAVAVKSGADGIHIGQDDVSAREARRVLGDDKIVGVSTKTVEQAKLAEASGADYLGVGAIYPTKTKSAPIMTSIETLAAICRAVSIPVVAIGGIKRFNMSPLRGTGISGVAVVTGIFAAPDVREAAAELRAEAERVIWNR